MPISPKQGSESGNQTVTITGINLTNATVKFGTTSATITANTPTSITVQSPAGNGAVPVTVTTSGGVSNALNFYYIPFPAVTNLSLTAGPVSGGNTIEIHGYNLFTATNVNFGSNSAVPKIVSNAIITAVIPAGSSVGTVYVSVETAGGVTSSVNYTYIDSPTINNVTPTSGPTTGGTCVTIAGTNFSSVTSVTIGGNPASFAAINSNTVAIITPSHAAGFTDVSVTTSAGTATIVDAFIYISSPGI